MVAIDEALKKFWRRQGIKLCSGATEDELIAFETKHHVRLPEDLRKYFAATNGFDGSEHLMTDDEGITFLGLDEMKPLSEYWSADVAVGRGYFVFADYSLSAHVYAIRLVNGSGSGNPVVAVYDRKLVEVASSFLEFAESYLKNIDAVLFPQPQA
jgi:hypothetical protein